MYYDYKTLVGSFFIKITGANNLVNVCHEDTLSNGSLPRTPDPTIGGTFVDFKSTEFFCGGAPLTYL
jgi:hypothetical protein